MKLLYNIRTNLNIANHLAGGYDVTHYRQQIDLIDLNYIHINGKSISVSVWSGKTGADALIQFRGYYIIAPRV